MSNRDKHWDFFVSEHSVYPVVAPVIAAHFPDGDTARGMDRWGNEGKATLNEQRSQMLAENLANQMSYGAVEFEHDPEHAEDPVVDRAGLQRAVRSYVDGEHDQPPDYRPPQPAAKPLFNDDFKPDAEVDAFVDAIVAAIIEGIENGAIEVDASEPYDSCRNCGGYHNVNDRC